MANTEFKLFAETDNSGNSYTVTVEESFKGLVRLVVSRSLEGVAQDEAFQGVDLTAEECEALGRHLISMAELLNKYGE